MKGNGPPIIIKKVKKGGQHDAPHGGAWKVAYADFVTAMMAFFLLLWLLNVTTDIQKRGIADYFQETVAPTSQSGAGGVLGGVTIGQPGSEVVPSTVPTIRKTAPIMPPASNEADYDRASHTPLGEDGTARRGHKGVKPDQGEATKPSQAKKLAAKELAAKEKARQAREDKQFKDAEKALRQAIQAIPDLRNLAKDLIIDRTPEGLRIQIVDQDRLSMFPLGSAEMIEPARRLMALVAQVVEKLPNRIAITGHTDATPYARGAAYGNWELSADRANACRRELIGDGVPAERIARVAGVADRDPLVPQDPISARNRRISIVLLRQNPPASPPTAPKVPAPG